MNQARSVLLSIFDRFRDDHGSAYHHIEGDLTYAELYGRASALSAYLVAQDVKRSPIVIWGHKHQSYHVAYWACLLAGRPLVPMEPDTPPQRFQHVIDSCGVGLILSTEPIPNLSDTCSPEVMHIRDYEAESAQPDVADNDGSDIAYIMYSSGSSGTPKGIMVSYSNLAHFIEWLRGTLLETTEFQSVTGNVRHCFDVSFFELWAAWSRQRPISALDHNEFINSRKYIDRYARHRVGLWVSTPSAVQSYLKDRRFSSKYLPELTTFLFCGEVLSKQTVKVLRGRFPLARVINTYGPTECTVAVTSVDIEDHHLNDDKPLPIGFVRPGCTIVQHDEQIAISGAPVGLGYVKLPEKTRKAFPTKNSYLTGDSGFCTEDGLWYFRGRLDREIKLNGHRIDPSEIEQELCKLQSVQLAFVEPMEVGGNPRVLAAYLHGPADVSDLAAIAEKLACVLLPTMVPKFWYLCSDLRFNQNTKVDKAELIRIARSSANFCTYPRMTERAKSLSTFPPRVEVKELALDGLGFLKVAEDAVRKEGPIVTLALPRNGREITLLANSKHVRFWQENEVLFVKDHRNAGSGAAAMRSVLGRTLQTARSGEEWNTLHKEMIGLLNSNKAWFQRPLENATLQLVQGLQSNKPRPLVELCLNWAMRSICDPLFQCVNAEPVASGLLDILDRNFFERMAALPPSHSDDEITKHIEEAMRQIAKDAGSESIADLILRAEQMPDNNDEKMQRIVTGLLAASVHMNALTLFWALVFLADNAELQKEMSEEGRTYGAGFRRVAQTPLAFATLRETLRLRPVTAFVERQVAMPFELDGFSFETGQSVLFSPIMVHSERDTWADPTRFDPNRFLNGQPIKRGTYLPFGIGRRTCPGANIVNQQLSYALSLICQHVTLAHTPQTRPGDLRHIFKIVLEPRGAVRLSAHRILEQQGALDVL